MVISALTFRQDVVNRQGFSRAAVNTFMSIPSLNAFSPHTFSVAATEAEEFLHEASRGIHWLIGLGVLSSGNFKRDDHRLALLVNNLDTVGSNVV